MDKISRESRALSRSGIRRLRKDACGSTPAISKTTPNRNTHARRKAARPKGSCPAAAAAHTAASSTASRKNGENASSNSTRQAVSSCPAVTEKYPAARSIPTAAEPLERDFFFAAARRHSTARKNTTP